jgi:hypothetical protein
LLSFMTFSRIEASEGTDSRKKSFMRFVRRRETSFRVLGKRRALMFRFAVLSCLGSGAFRFWCDKIFLIQLKLVLNRSTFPEAFTCQQLQPTQDSLITSLPPYSARPLSSVFRRRSSLSTPSTKYAIYHRKSRSEIAFKCFFLSTDSALFLLVNSAFRFALF